VKDFGRSDAEMALATPATLALRPIGALIFGLMADRDGRRRPLKTAEFDGVLEAMTRSNRTSSSGGSKQRGRSVVGIVRHMPFL